MAFCLRMPSSWTWSKLPELPSLVSFCCCCLWLNDYSCQFIFSDLFVLHEMNRPPSFCCHFPFLLSLLTFIPPSLQAPLLAPWTRWATRSTPRRSPPTPTAPSSRASRERLRTSTRRCCRYSLCVGDWWFLLFAWLLLWVVLAVRCWRLGCINMFWLSGVQYHESNLILPSDYWPFSLPLSLSFAGQQGGISRDDESLCRRRRKRYECACCCRDVLCCFRLWIMLTSLKYVQVGLFWRCTVRNTVTLCQKKNYALQKIWTLWTCLNIFSLSFPTQACVWRTTTRRPGRASSSARRRRSARSETTACWSRGVWWVWCVWCVGFYCVLDFTDSIVASNLFQLLIFPSTSTLLFNYFFLSPLSSPTLDSSRTPTTLRSRCSQTHTETSSPFLRGERCLCLRWYDLNSICWCSGGGFYPESYGCTRNFTVCIYVKDCASWMLPWYKHPLFIANLSLSCPSTHRECSVQRRNQKVVEESPSCLLTPATRKKMQVRNSKCVIVNVVDVMNMDWVETVLCVKLSFETE